MDFDIDLNEVVDELLDRNKKLTLENILLHKTLSMAVTEIDQLTAVLQPVTAGEVEDTPDTAAAG